MHIILYFAKVAWSGTPVRPRGHPPQGKVHASTGITCDYSMLLGVLPQQSHYIKILTLLATLKESLIAHHILCKVNSWIMEETFFADTGAI